MCVNVATLAQLHRLCSLGEGRGGVVTHDLERT
jgi:hypothetical protein